MIALGRAFTQPKINRSHTGYVEEVLPGSLNANGLVQTVFVGIASFGVVSKTKGREKLETDWVFLTQTQFIENYEKMGLSYQDKLKVLTGIGYVFNKSRDVPTITIQYDTIESEEVPNRNLIAYKFVSISNLPKGVKTVEEQQAEKTRKLAGAAGWASPESALAFTPVNIPPINPETQIQIGYAVLDVPITYVEQNRQSYIDQIPGLRQAGTIKKATGKSYENYNISYIVKNGDEIASCVRDVIDQVSLTPFLPVAGGPFGATPEEGDIHYHAIAVRGVTLTTVPGQPNSLKVDMEFDPFNWEVWCGLDAGDGAILGGDKSRTFPRYTFSDMFCMPLFKLWCKTRQKSRYNGQKFNGEFVLSFPSPETFSVIGKLLGEGATTDNGKNLSALSGLQEIIEGSPSNSPDAKKINLSSRDVLNTGYAVVRVYDKVTWNKLVPYPIGVIGPMPTSFIQPSSEAFSGLVLWSKLSAFNSASEDGELLPNSNQINPNLLSGALSQGQPLKNPAGQSVVLDIAEIKSPGLVNKSMDAQLEDWTLNTSPFGLSSADLKKAMREEPWNFFGVLLKIDDKTKGTLHGKVKAITENLKTINSVSYQSLNQKLAEAFIDAPTTVPYVAIKSPGNPSNTEDIIIESIAGSRGHNLSLYSAFFDALPLHQYAGGISAEFVVQGKCFGKAAKKKLEALKHEFDHRAVNAPSPRLMGQDASIKAMEDRIGPAFLKVRNELFQLLGVDFVIPQSLSFQSMDGQPGVWAFSMSFLEHDVSLLKGERIQFLPTYLQNLGKAYHQGVLSSTLAPYTNPIVDRAREHFSLLYSLSQVETYPDMALPTIGEVEYWIRLCKSAAERRLSKTTNTPFKPLDKQDELLLPHIDEFIGSYSKEMSDWDVKNRSSTLNKGGRGAFADPDFYCWYDHRQAWKTIFDVITEDMMGKMANGLKAEGSTSPIPPVWRESDTALDTTTVHDHRYHSMDENLIKEINGDTKNSNKGVQYYINNTEPKWRAKTVVETVLNKDEEYDNSAPGFIWWGPASVFDPETDTAVIDGKLEELLNDVIISPGRQSDPLEPGKTPGTLTAIFHDIGSKQSIVRELISLGSGKRLPRNILDRGPINIGGKSIENSFLLSESGLNLLETGRASISPGDTMDYLDFKNLASLIFRLQMGEEIEDKVNAYGFPPTFTSNLKDKLPFLTRTIISTENYKRTQGRPDLKQNVEVTGNPEQNIENSWSFVDEIASVDNVDPNVLRALILKRTGAGASNPSFSQETGFSDFDKGVLDSISIGSKYGKLTNKFAIGLAKISHIYSSYLDRYGYPTLALIALHMRLKTAGNAQYIENGEISKKYDKQLTETRNAIDVNPVGVKAVESIQGITQTIYKEIAPVTSYYYAGYIELCRAYGSTYIQGQRWDPFFNPLNALIVMDIGENTGQFVTKFTPDSSYIGIAADRAHLNQGPVDLRKAGITINEDKENAELIAARQRKLMSSLSPVSETSIYGFLHDLRHHGVYGRLLAAFPTYQILLINEGYYWLAGNIKLWDQFYTRTGVAAIEVFRSKEHAASECNITFSNAFYKLTAHHLQHALEQQITEYNRKRVEKAIRSFPSNTGDFIGFNLNQYITKDTPEELLKIWQNNQLKQLALNVGTRVQVRLGYGSNTSALPVVFNGTVVNAPVSEGYLTLLCVGDGGELNNQSTTKLVPSGNSFAFSDGGAFGIGKDPSSILTEAIVAGGSFDSILQGNFRDFSSGIAHFGDVYFAEGRSWPSELQINIYSSNPTKLEQGLGSVQNYFNVNALYNFNNSHLFSVDVQEPTTWKVAQVCRRACLDFVASAELFSTRSTLFFGKWWWPYNYTWDESILNLDIAESPIGSMGPSSTPTPVVPFDPVRPMSGQYGIRPDKTAHEDTEANRRPELPNPTKPDKKIDWLTNLNDIPAAIYSDLKDRYPGSVNGIRGYRIGRTSDALQSFTTYTIDLGNGRYPVYDYALGGLGGASASFKKELSQNDIVSDRSGTLPDAAKSPYVLGSVSKDTSSDPSSPFYSNKSPAGLLRDVEDLTQYMKWKPFTQAYFAHSMINMIDNNIEASKEGVFTDAIGQHSYNGWISGDSVTRTITYSIDSIPGYVPVPIRHKNGDIDILPIEELCPETPTNNEKSRWFDTDYEVLDENGWVKVRGFMAHKTNKKTYTSLLNSGLVDTTEDHSLVLCDGDSVTPIEAQGLCGKTVRSKLPQSPKGMDLEEAWFWGFFCAEGTANVYGPPKRKGVLYQIKINNSEVELLERAQAAWLKIGVKSKIVQYNSEDHQNNGTGKYENCKSILTLLPVFDNKKGAKKRYCQYLIETCYTKRHEKRLPKFILNSTIEVQAAFLDGYYAGDGKKKNIKFPAKSGIRYHEMDSRDMTLLAGVYWLIQNLSGHKSMCSTTWKIRRGKPKQYYKISERANRGRGIIWRLPDDLIKKVEESYRQEEIVYDLHTGSGTFCAGIGNVLVHNTDIIAADRQTALVDTGIALTGIQEGIGKGLAGAALKIASYIPFVGSLFDEANTALRETPNTPAIENSVVSFLVDSAKNMYQGSFTIMGSPTIKPMDLIYLTDHINDLKGPVFVREVIHRMDAQVGFITIITPDCVVVPHSSAVGAQIVTALGSGPLHRIGAFMVYKAASAAIWGAMSGKIRKTRAENVLDSVRRYYLVVDSSPEDLKTGMVSSLKPSAVDAVKAELQEKLDDLDKQISEASFEDKVKLSNKRKGLIDESEGIIKKLSSIKDDDITGFIKELRSGGFGYILDDEKYSLLSKLPGGEIRAKMIIQEELFKIEEEELLKMARESKIFQNLPIEDKEGAVRRLMAESRAKYYEGLGPDADKVYSEIRNLVINDLDLPGLQNRVSSIVEELTRDTKKAMSLEKRANLLNELDREIAKYFAAYEKVDFDSLPREVQSVLTRVKDFYTRSIGKKLVTEEVSFLRRVFVDAPFGSISTLTRGVAGVITGGDIPEVAKKVAGTGKKAVEWFTHPSVPIKLLGAQLEAGAEFLGLKDSEKFLEETKGLSKESPEYERIAKKYERYRNIKRIAAMNKLKTAARGGYQTSKEIVTAGRILSYAGPQAIVRLAMDVALFTIGGQIVEGINARTKARQCVKIIPLMAGDHPYLGGLRGHAGAIIGDDPSWSDNLVTTFGINMAGNWGLMGSILTPVDWMGIEIPNYGRTETDEAWLSLYRSRKEEIDQYLNRPVGS